QIIASIATAPPSLPALPNVVVVPEGTATVDLAPFFPKSGGVDGLGQQTTEACTAWSSAYNLRSYYAGRVNGLAIASGPGGRPDTTHTFSPSFVWNSLNGGV